MSIDPPMGRRAEVLSFAMEQPADLSGLTAAIASGAVDPKGIVCLYLKTPGNGGDNDFSRDLGLMALGRLLAEHGADPLVVASGGCEGVLSPHMVVIQVRRAPPSAERALAVARARTRALAPEEIGRHGQALATADAVAAAMAEAGLAPEDVVLVQVKAALLTDAAIAEARRRGVAVVAPRPHESKPGTRAASALGVALALGELQGVGDADIGTIDFRTSRALVTPGSLDMRNDIVVYGHGRGWSGPHRVASAGLEDLIDLGTVVRLLGGLGLHPAPQLAPAETARIDAVLFKGDPPLDERIRGNRHVIWRDSDILPARHLRAAVGGLLAGVLGTTRVYCSGGAEHQGPSGGGVLAVFARAG